MHHRHALPDSDGPYVKAELDGIVDAGLLPDDSPRHISSTAHEYVEIPPGEEERMVFVFVRVGRSALSRR